jgi:hypothetical protein
LRIEIEVKRLGRYGVMTAPTEGNPTFAIGMKGDLDAGQARNRVAEAYARTSPEDEFEVTVVNARRQQVAAPHDLQSVIREFPNRAGGVRQPPF